MSYTAGVATQHSHAIGTLHEPYDKRYFPTNATAYPTADLAIYCPLRVFERVVVRALYCCNGTVSGNVDLGIYDASGTRLVSAGTTTHTGSNSEQVIDTTDVTIGPGLYYIAVTLNNATGGLRAYAPAAPIAASFGLLTEQLGTGAALPATATWAVAQTLAYVPNIGALIETTVT